MKGLQFIMKLYKKKRPQHLLLNKNTVTKYNITNVTVTWMSKAFTTKQLRQLKLIKIINKKEQIN